VEVELVVLESGELQNTAVVQSPFPADPNPGDNIHTEVVRVGTVVSLPLPFSARAVVEFLTAPPTVQQAVFTEASLIAAGNIANSGCNSDKPLGPSSPGTLLLNAKESQPGCRIVLDAEAATKSEIDAFPVGTTLTFRDLAGWEEAQIIERYPGVFQITWRPTVGAGTQDSFAIVVRLLNPTSRCPDCNSLDSDGDGLWNDWEQFGVDTDGDGTANLHLPEANPDEPDIYVEIDYMDCTIAGGDCEPGDVHTHKPKAEAIALVVEAFAQGGGNRGPIRLHIDVADEGRPIPHDQLLPFASEFGKNFGVVKDQYFRPDNPRRFAYHYGLFIHQLRKGAHVSGQAEKPGNDFVIAFGGWNLGGVEDVDGDGLPDAGVGTVLQQAGALMHELGHNLGLDHGGGDSFNYKPNYPSVMNYAFQLTGISSSGGANQNGSTLARLTYSDGQNVTLDENNLQEDIELCPGCAPFITRYACPYNFACPAPPEVAVATVQTASSVGPIDWNCNGETTDSGIITDLNGDCKKDSPLKDFNDWTNLRVAFQSTRAFADDGSSDSGVLEEELDTIDLNTLLSSSKDSFMRRGAGNSNEGENPALLLQSDSNVVVGFDLSQSPSPGVTKATLKLKVAQAIRNGGKGEFSVQLYRLRGSFDEGNGVNWASTLQQPRKPGSGPGVTWQCATDAALEKAGTDCEVRWNGGEAAIIPVTVQEVKLSDDLQVGDTVEWDVTMDVQDAIAEGETEVVWLLKKKRGPGQIVYHSRQRALAVGDASLAPSLLLEFH